MTNAKNGAVTSNMVSITAEELAELRAAKEALESKSEIKPKVSSKGAITFSGFGQWPVTMYVDQLERFAAFMPNALTFAKDNAALLDRKTDSAAIKASKQAARKLAGILTPEEAQEAYAARQAAKTANS